MQYQKLGNTNINASVITLGTWGIGGAGWGKTDYEQCEKAVNKAIELGINMIDTAPAYNDGCAERLLGHVIGRNRQDLILVTKAGTQYKNGRYIRDNSAKGIRQQCEESLRYLRTDYLDVYLVHWPDSNIPAGETFTEMQRLKQEGKIRHIGVSNHSVDQIKEAEDYCDVEIVQDQYSMVNIREEKKLAKLHQQGYGTMTYGSMGAGILSGKYRKIPKLDKQDMRMNFYNFFEEPYFSKIQKLLKIMDSIAENHNNAALSQIALNWSLSKLFVDTAIVGIRSEQHIIENCMCTVSQLSKEEISCLDQAVKELYDGI